MASRVDLSNVLFDRWREDGGGNVAALIFSALRCLLCTNQFTDDVPSVVCCGSGRMSYRSSILSFIHSCGFGYGYLGHRCICFLLMSHYYHYYQTSWCWGRENSLILLLLMLFPSSIHMHPHGTLHILHIHITKPSHIKHPPPNKKKLNRN